MCPAEEWPSPRGGPLPSLPLKSLRPPSQHVDLHRLCQSLSLLHPAGLDSVPRHEGMKRAPVSGVRAGVAVDSPECVMSLRTRLCPGRPHSLPAAKALGGLEVWITLLETPASLLPRWARAWASPSRCAWEGSPAARTPARPPSVGPVVYTRATAGVPRRAPLSSPPSHHSTWNQRWQGIPKPGGHARQPVPGRAGDSSPAAGSRDLFHACALSLWLCK